MRGTILAALATAIILPSGIAHAEDETGDLSVDRYVLSARVEYGQVHSHETDFGALGGSLGLHVPLADLALGLYVGTSLLGGDGHIASTTDLGLRYYLPISGDTQTLQPYVKAMTSLSIVSWDEQDTTAAFGGGLGLGLQAWTWDSVALDFEFSYRVMGGSELRQTLMGSIGIAFGM